MLVCFAAVALRLVTLCIRGCTSQLLHKREVAAVASILQAATLCLTLHGTSTPQLVVGCGSIVHVVCGMGFAVRCSLSSCDLQVDRALSATEVPTSHDVSF